MLNKLKEQVWRANLELFKSGVVIFTWGNVSGIDRESGLVVIKPSGVEYEKMRPEDMTVVDVCTGKTVEGEYRPSTDTPTHLELYRSFSDVGGIVHTHSVYAVAYAQAGVDIPALGTTHADHFLGSIPCTREMSEEEVLESYEENTGKIIVSCFEQRGLDPSQVPAALVKNHGPFTWGKNAEEAVYHAIVLERVAEMNLLTAMINPHADLADYLLKKHYFRKHGSKAYYGQT